MGIRGKDLLEAYINSNHFGKVIGMDFSVMAPGMVEYRLCIKKEHLATPVAAHGGVIGALADAALGVAGLSLVCEEGHIVSTVEYKINFLSPALKGDELLATGKVEHAGKRLLVITCEIICKNRNVQIACGQGTFNRYDAAKGGYGGGE